MAVRTAIFDFDGTIADTFAEAVVVLNALAPEFGYRSVDAEEIELLRRLSPREVAQHVGVAWHRLPLLAARARKDMAARMSHISACEGVVDALTTLRSAGLSIGLLTSNSRQNVDQFLSRRPIAFDFISAGSGLFSKHRRLLSLMRRHGLAAHECAYIGDEARDIEAGRAAGMRTIAVAWGFSAAEALATCKPDHLIADPAELLLALR